MKTTLLAAIGALLCLSGCANGGGLADRREADRHALEAAREIGPAEGCVLRRDIRHSRVLDDRTIDFHLAGGRVLRNRLPQACPGLAFDESFSYRTSLDRLCSVDTITVRTPAGPGPTCGLGRFQPVELPRR